MQTDSYPGIASTCRSLITQITVIPSLIKKFWIIKRFKNVSPTRTHDFDYQSRVITEVCTTILMSLLYYLTVNEIFVLPEQPNCTQTRALTYISNLHIFVITENSFTYPLKWHTTNVSVGFQQHIKVQCIVYKTAVLTWFSALGSDEGCDARYY